MRFKTHRLAMAVTLLFAAPAWAVDFDIADGWAASWTTSVSLGSSWRARNADSRLYGQANGALLGRTDGTGSNTTDEGNLNYGKGDAYTTLFKVISEVEVKKGTAGALLRGKGWYDYTLEHQSVALGSQSNGYNGFNPATNSLGAPRPLSDAGFERLNRFKGVSLLDAYVYDTFDAGGKPLQVRLGNQVVNWGESLFIQGLNQINPIDVPSFRKPGAQLKEVLLPVPIAFASLGLGSAGSLEGFYQAQWKNTPIEAGCGNYWSVAGGNISSSPGACNLATAVGTSSPMGTAVGAFIPSVDGPKPKNSGQFGLAYRVNVAPLDTEFGLYGMNIHSRTPVLSVKFGNYGTLFPIAGVWEYPENIKVFGLSAVTNILGWSVAGELSHSRGVPAQIDGNDALVAALAAQGVIPGLPAGTPFGPRGAASVAAAAANGYLPGYTRTNKTQLQFNLVQAGNKLFGADQYLLVGELGFQWNNLPDYQNDPNATRYNRAFIFGPGTHPLYGGTCIGNVSAEGCLNDGYTSRFAWGYRTKLELTYNTDAGVTVYPSVFWSHDVKGYSVDNQFLEDRKALGLGVRFSYAKKYNLELGAVMFDRNAKYDPLRDRDFYSVSVSTSF